MFALDPISVAHMKGVHEDLIRVVQDIAANGVMPFTFGISQGIRSIAQQKLDVASGKSQTMRSRHLDGHAVDFVVLVNGVVSCDKEMADYTETAALESAAYFLRSKGKGGVGFVDGPHLELPWDKYHSGATVPKVA